MENEKSDWFHNWPDALIGVDENSSICEVSDKASAILGWKKEELLGKNLHTTLCANSRGHQHPQEQCPLSRTEKHSELASSLWKKKDGCYLSVDTRTVSISYRSATRLVSFIDNSSRPHNQAEMNKFSEYVEMSPAPMGEFSIDGQLLFGNWSLQELLLDFGFDDDGYAIAFPKNIESIGQQLVDTPESKQQTEVEVDGKTYVWHFHILDGEAEKTLVSHAYDITAQKKAEQLAQEQQARVRKEFYSKMVHELRTPLNAIIGFSDILISRSSDKLSSREIGRLDMIKNAGVQLNELVTSTLDIAKIESGKMGLDISEFAMAEVVEEIHGQIKTLANKKSLVFRDTVQTKQHIFSDRTKVRQIMINLLSNAIKYTREGSVDLLIAEKTHIEIGPSISIMVTDTGIGIADHQMSSLFRSFEQLEDEQSKGVEGTGLGLVLVSNLVALLGGVIHVESQYGKGSTFEVLLPFSNNFQPQTV